MKKLIFLIFVLFIGILGARQINLISFQAVPADFQAQLNPVSDMNMEYCAALKIESDFTDQIDLKQKVYQRETAADNAEYLYFSSSENELILTAPGHEAYSLTAPDDGFKKGMVYYLKLESIPTPEPEPALAGKPQPEPQPDPQPDSQPEPSAWDITAERLGIEFTVTYVEMFDNQLLIRLSLLNNKDDKEVQIRGWHGDKYTRFFDNDGNEYKPEKVTLANQSQQRDVKSMLIQDIPTTATIQFKDVKNSAENIAKFDLGIWTEESGYFHVSFRDLQIDKK
ncbi:MAG: hypothetical protein R6U84_04470 [Candidatus Cloacimonadales bacterium]